MRRRFPLLDLDPDLGALVREEVRDACRRELDVEVHRLPQGPWGAGGEHADAEHAGLLMVDGVIARDVVVSDTVSTELLGPGDVVRPWSLQASPGLLRSTIPLTLSHRMLGQLVGARRPTVSSAIGELASRDELVRRDDGTWLLKGDPV